MPERVTQHTIKRAKSGDKSAITELYQQYKPEIYRYLYYKVGKAQLAEDLTADVFIRVLENLHQYQPRTAPFQAWVFRIARNLTIDHYRRMNTRNHLYLNESLPSEQGDPEAAADRSLTVNQLQHALRRLTDDQSDVIILRFIADMPIKQVAQALNKSESAVKALQARGLEALQRILRQRELFHG